MITSYRPLLCVAILALLPGCAAWKNSARIDPQTVAIYSAGEAQKERRATATRAADEDCPLTNGLYDDKRGSLNLDCFRFPEQRDLARKAETNAVLPPGRTAYQMAADPGDAGKVARNRLSAILIKRADDVCVVEKGRLVMTESSSNFLLSLLTSTFAGVSTVVGGETAKSILSGLAALTSSTQNNVNATFYRNQLTQAINKAIDTERSRIMVEIVAGRAKAQDAYNVDEMVRLANAYHHACSFEKGLQLLLDAALDKSGAGAALESRSREAAIQRLKAHILYLDGRIRDAGEDAKLKGDLSKQREEAAAQLHGLQMAAAGKQVTEPHAGDAPPAPEPQAEEQPEDGTPAPSA